jgi:hypothetical protein
MNQTKRRAVSRRDFARRAILFSATASLIPATIASAQEPATGTAPNATQDQPNLPKLSAASQAEVDSRVQQILALHGNDFDDTQTQLLKTLCILVQPALDRVRAYPLQNGDVPGLVLKPLMEREKKPQTPHSAAAPKNS